MILVTIYQIQISFSHNSPPESILAAPQCLVSRTLCRVASPSLWFVLAYMVPYGLTPSEFTQEREMENGTMRRLCITFITSYWLELSHMVTFNYKEM